MSEKQCVFCKIVRKEAPASIVYEDEVVLAFMDIRPVSEGHTLIIPKQHWIDVFDIPEELLASTHKIAKKIALAVKEAAQADGVSIVQQNGKAAGQDIFHLHIHVIPRFEGKKMPRFEELGVADRETLEKSAEKVRRHLE
jgi:histidine triad (HIT) family protein